MNINLYSFKLLLLVALLTKAFAPDTAKAQQLGLANSNYAGTHGLYTNPSAIADSRHKFYFNLFSAEAGVLNNYVRYDSPVSLYKVYKDELEIESEHLKVELDGKPKFVMAGLDVRGPSFMLRLSPKHSVAFTSRIRGSFQATNLSEDFARVYTLYNDSRGDEENYFDEYKDLANTLTQNNTFNLNANLYSELGLSYARVVLDKEDHFLKAGVTVKRLAGGYSAHMINEGTNFKVEERPVAGQDEEDIVLILERTKLKYGYLTEDAYWDTEVSSASDALNMLAGRNSAGQGWGADLGFTYEFRSNSDQYRSMMDGKEVVDQEKNKYKFRIAVALMDLGGINYDSPLYVKGYDTEKNNKELNLSAFAREENIEDVEEIEDDDIERYADILYDALDITDADKRTSFRSGLPTVLNVNVDYKITNHIYANATWIHSMRGKNNIGMRQGSLLAFTPRFEFKKFEVAFPVAIQNDYSVVTTGAMVRFLNIFVGSDNIGGAFNIGDVYGANVYMGVSILPMLKRNKKDKDKDGVSNRKDKCKKVPGTWELMGCPDTDKDGVADKDDACPAIAGSAAHQGCPPPAAAAQESAPGSQAAPAPVSQTNAPANSPGTAPVNSPTVAAPVESSNTANTSPESTPTDMLSSLPINSVGTSPADSLSQAVIETAKALAGDSLSTTTVKSLENAQPANTSETTPATKPESGTEPTPGTNKEATTATTPAATPQVVTPKKAVNN